MIISKINDQARLVFFPTSKFKDLTISVQFFMDATAQNVSNMAMASGIVVDQSELYSSKVELNKKLDDLYGANYTVNRSIKGNKLICNFLFHGINGLYLEKDILLEQLEFLRQMIYFPKVKDNKFDESLFLEAKENLMYQFKSKKDKAARYAVTRAMELYGQDYPLGLDTLGNKDIVEKIDNKELYDWYCEMINNCYFEIVIIGECNQEVIKKAVQNRMPKVKTSVDTVCYSKPRADYQKIIEKASIDQSQLVMIYNGSVNFSSLDYYSLSVGCAIFGQLPTSLLFSEIREKRSLCYSIYSRTFVFESGIYVATGTDVSNLEESETVINELFGQMQKGEFTQQMVEVAKDMIINSLNSNFDDFVGILNVVFKLNHVNSELDYDKTVELIKQVDIQSIQKVFNDLHLELVYQYAQRSENENN